MRKAQKIFHATIIKSNPFKEEKESFTLYVKIKNQADYKWMDR